MEDDNFTSSIGSYTMHAIKDCKNQRELDIANNVLMAITGYSLETILNKIEERDAEGYVWESIDD